MELGIGHEADWERPMAAFTVIKRGAIKETFVTTNRADDYFAEIDPWPGEMSPGLYLNEILPTDSLARLDCWMKEYSRWKESRVQAETCKRIAKWQDGECEQRRTRVKRRDCGQCLYRMYKALSQGELPEDT